MRFVVILVILAAIAAPQVSAGPAMLSGPVNGLDNKLVARLLVMTKHFGPLVITKHGGCRLKGSKAAPKSLHRIAAGCKAADIMVKGSKKQLAMLAWWKKRYGGGTGYYCGRPFIHVDIGPRRSWAWFCRNGRRSQVLARLK